MKVEVKGEQKEKKTKERRRMVQSIIGVSEVALYISVVTVGL